MVIWNVLCSFIFHPIWHDNPNMFFFLILALKPPIGFWGSKFDMTHYVTKFLVFVQHVFGFLFCICVLRFLLSQLPESVANLELAIAGLATAPLG